MNSEATQPDPAPEREMVLQPPASRRLSMRDLSDFVDVTGLSWERFTSIINCRANLEKARRGELVPHNKTVDQLEADLEGLSVGFNMPKATTALIWLRYRTTNPRLTFDEVFDMDPIDFGRLSAQVQEMELANRGEEGGEEGEDPLGPSA